MNSTTDCTISTICLIAKFPILGYSKSRLIPGLGAENAQKLALAMLADIIALCSVWSLNLVRIIFSLFLSFQNRKDPSCVLVWYYSPFECRHDANELLELLGVRGLWMMHPVNSHYSGSSDLSPILVTAFRQCRTYLSIDFLLRYALLHFGTLHCWHQLLFLVTGVRWHFSGPTVRSFSCRVLRRDNKLCKPA